MLGGVSVEVHSSGPIFDGRAERAALELDDDIEEEVAGQASADVHANLDASIRHPTPYYETQVHVRIDPDAHVVTDSGVVYGRWLEGESPKNRSTRFLGYHSFKHAAETTRAQALRLAEAVVKRKVREME